MMRDRKTLQPAVGFIGLGSMGEPMALNLLRAGTRLLVWNRTMEKMKAAESAGAEVATSACEVLERSGTIILMLADSDAVDAVLERGDRGFASRVNDRMVVSMGTMSPTYSHELAVSIRGAGGRYVEAPVSGSRLPAEAGQLVAMLAGTPVDVATIDTLIAPMCRETIMCGPVPNAMSMKLGSNLFLLAMVTGLAEAVHYADRQGLDLDQFVTLLGSGPLGSDLLRAKAPKLVARDFSVQASIANALGSMQLIADGARSAQIKLPLIDMCLALFQEASCLGFHDKDVSAVLCSIEKRSDPTSSTQFETQQARLS